MILSRDHYLESGIFGRLRVSDTLTLATLEHAYPGSLNGERIWVPKVPEGSYSCHRGLHQLHSMQNQFETFEVTEVPGHTNILFHCGNNENDSEGCILLGLYEEDHYLYKSREAFSKFMNDLKDVQWFQLEIIIGDKK